MSSQRYQEFIAERTRLLERIKELEAENAELRKRLGEDVMLIEKAPTAMLNAMTSKLEKRGTGPGRRTFPDSVTKSSENSLHISRNLTNFVYKLHITRLYNLKIENSKLLKIFDICNFFLCIFLTI